MTPTDMLVAHGGEIETKGLADGRVGGYLVVFSTKNDPDLTGDFFTAETNFGPHKTTLTFYDHCMDRAIKSRVLDAGATLEVRDAGVWVEAQLDARDTYAQKILELATAGKLGWSSGTAGHLVEREQRGKSHWIKNWPLGLDASITPTPAEPRTMCVPLKSLFDEQDSPAGLTFDAHSDSVLATVQEFIKRAEDLKALRAQDGRKLSAERIGQLKHLHDELDRMLKSVSPTSNPLSLELLRAEVAGFAMSVTHGRQ